MIQKELLTVLNKKSYTPEQFKRKFCGKKIGEGCYRTVYEFKLDSRWVVKIEGENTEWCNITEWMNWWNNKTWTNLTNFLAPCLFISSGGHILIQRKVKKKHIKYYPSEIPSLFTDRKYGNFGWIGKRFVCHDYAYLVLTNIKMSKAKWWGKDDENYKKSIK